MFDLEKLLSTAERLKYLRGVKEEIRTELTEPSDWLVREMARRVHTSEPPCISKEVRSYQRNHQGVQPMNNETDLRRQISW